MLRIIIGVYWGPRRESISECASRLGQHFEALKVSSDGLSQWYRQGRRKPEATNPFDVSSSEVLAQLLERGVNRRDDNRQGIPELGFRVSLWNGDRSGCSASTQVGCGMCSPVKGLSNVALLDVSLSPGAALKPKEMVMLLKRMIEIWDPDTGKVFRNVDVPGKGDNGPDWEEVVYALYQTLSTSEEQSVPTGTVEPFARGRLWIGSNQRHLFEP